jgi:hypothetical protein
VLATPAGGPEDQDDVSAGNPSGFALANYATSIGVAVRDL